MTEGLDALTKLVKVVMAYRPDRAKEAKPVKKQRLASDKRDEKRPSQETT